MVQVCSSLFVSSEYHLSVKGLRPSIHESKTPFNTVIMEVLYTRCQIVSQPRFDTPLFVPRHNPDDVQNSW